MTLVASGALGADTKVEYLRTLVRGEALRQLDSLYDGVESKQNLNVDYINKRLAHYFPPVN